VGVHSGEVEFVGGDARGVAVHTAARVMSLAGADRCWSLPPRVTSSRVQACCSKMLGLTSSKGYRAHAHCSGCPPEHRSPRPMDPSARCPRRPAAGHRWRCLTRRGKMTF
jgi:hypothetical protein